MIGALVLDFPMAWQTGLPVLALLLFFVWRSLRGKALGPLKLTALIGLRGLALLLLVLLAARPVHVETDSAPARKRSVVLLMDKSESMSLIEAGESRYERAVDFVRDDLLPALRSANLPVKAMLFAEDAESVDGTGLADATPDGKRTNLGGAVARALAGSPDPPLVVIACTDGAFNENSDNPRAASALAEARVPMVGVGFGSDLGAHTLSLRQVEAPPVVAPKVTFRVGAHLEMVSPVELPAFDLILFRDGKLVEQKTVQAGRGSRFWLENFEVTETELGAHQYTVQMAPPNSPGLKSFNSSGTTSVRISNEKELRILYVQGALTWDYKFVSLALRNDPSIKLTGLTRTSQHSVFRQNIESAGELARGFPAAIEELAPYRLIVLSNLKPSDLTREQQELLARFCSELGGGLLLMGGAETFDSSWQESRLEQLLPVVFSGHQGPRGRDRPFRMELTDEALRHPVFQIADPAQMRAAWGRLPAFTEYGRVDAAKPGAQIWAFHQEDRGPNGRRILMAWQRYGAGISAVISVQNFWRWRLAKNSEPEQFDRFWRQLFRFIAESARQEVMIHLADQELRPQRDVQISLERQPDPDNAQQSSSQFLVRIQDAQQRQIQEQRLDLQPGRPVGMTFRAGKPGAYTVAAYNANLQPVAQRVIEIRDLNIEFQDTARNMETLRQWAAVTDGLALKVEDCRDASELVSQIKRKIEEARRSKTERRPAGMNAWVLTLLLGALGGEWLLRKRWSLR